MSSRTHVLSPCLSKKMNREKLKESFLYITRHFGAGEGSGLSVCCCISTKLVAYVNTQAEIKAFPWVIRVGAYPLRETTFLLFCFLEAALLFPL